MSQRNWLITGISSGLGKALAETVIESGDFVIGSFRKEEEVIDFNKRNEGKAIGILLDVTDEKGIEKAVNNIISKHQRIDVLVNNAGVGFIGAIEEASINEFRYVFEPNFFGALKLTQTVLPFMRNEGKGHIVQISSQAGVKAAAGFGVYNASKFALEGFSEALAAEVEPLGIKVLIVEPGPFRTNFAGASLISAKQTIDDYSNTAGAFRTRLRGVNGKQEGNPEKAAKAILYLVSQETSSLRMPLGKIAIASIEAKLESLQSDLEYHRTTAEGVVYE